MALETDMKTQTGTPEVSVIIPAHNASAFVPYAISSALASEAVKIEVIVVDDGSTDETWNLLDAYGDAIQAVRVANGGPYRARNLAAGLAKGEWLAFLDSDDEWEAEKLKKQLACADDQTSMVYTDCRNIGDTSRVKPFQSDNTAMFEGQIFRQLLHENFISLSSVLIRKSCFDRLGGFSLEATGVQDWDLWLRLSGWGGIVRLCREPLTKYRHHPAQMSIHVDDRLRDRLGVLARALKQPAAQDLSRWEIRQAFAKNIEISAWRAAESQPAKSLKLYVQAASYWPFSTHTIRQTVKCALACLGAVRRQNAVS